MTLTLLQNSSIRSECSSFNGVKVQNLLGCRNLDDEDPLLSLDSSTSNEDEVPFCKF